MWIKNEQAASAVISDNKGNSQNQNVNVDKTQTKLTGNNYTICQEAQLLLIGAFSCFFCQW